MNVNLFIKKNAQAAVGSSVQTGQGHAKKGRIGRFFRNALLYPMIASAIISGCTNSKSEYTIYPNSEPWVFTRNQGGDPIVAITLGNIKKKPDGTYTADITINRKPGSGMDDEPTSELIRGVAAGSRVTEVADPFTGATERLTVKSVDSNKVVVVTKAGIFRNYD